ncbi:MAG: ABC transporter ATP-binding protein [Rhodospirillales bacterium]|nr:ABC transporter ATP-binding protein [Rhodospirillales bacterium]
MSLLEVEDLRTCIDQPGGTVRAVDGVSFHVEAGESVGIVGESGCGKTMTGMSIMRLLPANGRIAGGRIRFDGRDLTGLSEHEMRHIRGSEIGVVFQDPMTSLNPNMMIGEQIAEPLRFHRGANKAKAMERALEVLGLVGMPRPAERLRDYPHQLSGGLRQRVMIAMALACEPKLLIADEPTTALDVTIQAQILALLADLTARLGMGLILITHDMGVVAGRADRVMVMYAARIVEMAETEALFERTHHPYTEALLASIPQLDRDTRRRLYSIPGMPPDLADLPRGCRFAPRCTYATERCREEDPALADSDPSHRYACFHPRNSPVEAAAADCAIVAEDDHSRPLPGAAVFPDQAGAILNLEEISKEYPVAAGALFRRRAGTLKAVSGVSLQLEHGETFGLVGESGCGKTTLGRLAVGLEAPTAGRVVFEGTDIASLQGQALRKARRHFQFMFQDPYASLDPRMRVGEIIEEPLEIQEIGGKAERKARVEALLDEVGLKADAAESYPHEFSGGQRQRIGLARALALNPRMIVADEPVSALDVSIRSQILNLMKRLQADHGLTYLVISHDLSVVRYLADRVGVMYLGRLVEVGTADDIYGRALHPYTTGLLRSIPVPRPSVERAKTDQAIKGELPSPLDPPSGCRFRTRCYLARQRCAEEEPLLRSFGGRHIAACHFPLQAPATEPPGQREQRVSG